MLLVGLSGFGQDSIVGKYHNGFASSIEIKEDSTFNYNFHYDLVRRWSIGAWKLKHDTLILSVINVYDTIVYDSKIEIVLSSDDKPERMTDEMNFSNTWNQDTLNPPSKMVYRKGKLYLIGDNGKLITKKYSPQGGKKIHPYYRKQE